jgi:tetratricopeptide (TPR) repeat protein
LLRKDRRYGDAIEQFSRAIELTLQLTNRDPDNTDLRSVLGWTYDNAGETWARWAKSETENALDRLGKAREMLEKARKVRLTLADMKPRWRQDLTYTDANLAMADALALEMAHKNLAAAAAYDRAANLSHQVANLNHEVPAASQRDDAFERTIELREWAAAAFMNAGASDEAREQLGKAIEDAKSHHSMAGDKEEESTVKRLEGLLRAIQK